MAMTLYALGTGDAETKANFWTQFYVEAEGRRVFVDCGGPLEKMLAANAQHGELAVTAADYHEILLTHLHKDHADGLAEMVNRNLHAGLPRTKLYAPQWMLDDLGHVDRPEWLMSMAKVPGGVAAFKRTFEFVPIGPTHDFGPFRIESHRTRHDPRCQAYRFTFDNFTLGCSADTGTDPQLLDWLAPCDVILHEAYVNPMPEDSWLRGMHTPLEDLLKLPRSFQEKTFLVHYADNYRSVPDSGGYRWLERGRAYHWPA